MDILVAKIPKIKTNLYVPETFSGNEITKEWHDYACYILHTINARRIFQHLAEDAYVPLMSSILKRVLPWHNYKKILNCLIDSGVIECDKSYQVGRKSKGYRLTEAYRGPHRRFLVTNTFLIRKLAKLKQDMHDAIIDPVHRYLYYWLTQIEIDSSLPIPCIQQIQNGEFDFSICDFGSRAHTNITNLPSEYRSLLHYKGRELSMIDISNSQPLLLGIVLLNFYQNDSNLDTSNTVKFELNYSNVDNSILYLNKQGERSPPLCGELYQKDVSRYLQLCEAGQVYEEFMRLGEITSRDSVKKMVFHTYFGDKYTQKQSKLTDVLAEHFPNVLECINQIKQKDYKHMAQVLQRMESSMVINRICRRMMNEHPETFLTTVHDCWIVPTDEIGKLIAIIQQEYAKVGVRPALKTSRLIKNDILAA